MPERSSAADLFQSIYDSFVGRDLTYVVGGGILVWSGSVAFGKSMTWLIEFTSQNGWRFAAMLAASLFTGYLAKESVCWLLRLSHVTDNNRSYSILRVRKFLVDTYGSGAEKLIERTVFLEHIGISAGVCGGVGAAILATRLAYMHGGKLPWGETNEPQLAVAVVVLVVLSTAGLLIFARKTRQLEQFLRHYLREERKDAVASAARRQ